jgi:small subunit ribosomal protein S2
MALPEYSMRQLLEAGVHFGHQAHRWNPKMRDFIFGTRNNIHIIDLAQSVPMLHRALEAVSDTVAKGGRILFVGTKRQAQDPIADAAKRCAQYYVNSRWLGGTLTNWKTISGSISAPAQARGDAVLQRGAGLHEEGTPRPAARARQARPLARRHQGHGRPARPAVRHRHQQGGHRDQGGAASGRSGCGVVDTNCDPGRHQLRHPGQRRRQRAPFRSTAISSRRPPSTAFRARKASLGIDIGAAEKPLAEAVPKRPRKQGLGFEPLAGPRGVADDLKKLPGISPAIEKKLNDLGIFHYSQIAELSATAAHNVGEEVGLPGRVESWIAKAKELTAE